MRLTLATAIALTLILLVGCSGSSSNTSNTATSSESGEDTHIKIENPQVRITIEDQTPAQREADTFTPVTVSFVGSDTATPVLSSDGRYRVVYELILTNTKPVPASLDAVEVLDPANDSQVLRLEDKYLLDKLRTLDVKPVDDASLPPNEARLLYLTAIFDSEDTIPEALDHQLEVQGADNPGATEASSLSYKAGHLALSKDAPPVFSPPLEGEGWLAFNGCCELGHPHRESVQSINGELFNSQRFAIDFLRLDDDGRLAEGDPTDVSNWVGYGAKVMAAADGVVVDTLHELEDNKPGSLPDPSMFTTLASVDGNHVVIDHGNGLYSFYAHLQQGSVKVKVGDKVQAGDQLGLLGNTGNTSGPHMHFHIMSGPSPLGSDAIPFVFDSFLLAGVANPTDAEIDAAFSKGAASFPSRDGLNPVRHEKEMPLDNAIMDLTSG
jgi:hypothetical protein